MVNYREILRLQSLGYSQRQIASSVRSSRYTVSQVCRLTTIHGLEWPLPDGMTNLMYNEEAFSEWASYIGPNTLAVVQQFLRTGAVAEKLFNVWARSQVYAPTPNIKTINTVLRTDHDKIEQQAATKEFGPGRRYGFTRGAAHFGGEKDD